MHASAVQCRRNESLVDIGRAGSKLERGGHPFVQKMETPPPFR
jgi:hypothetical protein